MKKPTTRITTHDHAPASFEQIEQLAMDRAESEAFEIAKTFENCRRQKKQTDLACELEREKVQAALDKKWMAEQLTNVQFQLAKARAERTACVLVIVLTVVLGLMVAFGGGV